MLNVPSLAPVPSRLRLVLQCTASTFTLLYGWLLLPQLAAAGTGVITPLVVDDDIVPGVGSVTSITKFAVNNSGQWLVEAETNAAPGTGAVLLRDGELVLREGDPIAGPPGILIDNFDSVTLNESGQMGFNFDLDGTSSFENESVHAYLDTSVVPLVGNVLVAQEGDPAPNLSPVSTLSNFSDVKINNAGQLLVTATVDDPLIPGGVERALYLWTTDSAAGGIVTSTLIAVEGDVLPGQTDALTDFGTLPHETALNNAGHVLFAVDIPGGDAIYLFDGGFTEVAQEGDPSPVAGRNWASLNSTALDLNDNGQHVFLGSLDGPTDSDSIIVRDGQKLIQEGDTLPAVGGFAFTRFSIPGAAGPGPLDISDSGEVLWWGDWDEPGFDHTGLFVDFELLVREGTHVGGDLDVVDVLRGRAHQYHMSNNGRFVVFEASLSTAGEGAFLIERTLPLIFADGFESGDTSAWSSSQGE